MSKFTSNTKGTQPVSQPTILNHAGGPAFDLNSNLKDKVVLSAISSFFGEPKFYGDNTSELVSDVRKLVQIDPKFVSNLARFLRKEMNLRSTPHMITAELVAGAKGFEYTKDTVSEVCQRADDTYEILAYYLATFGKPIPNSLKKGLANALNKFDEYQIAKYDRSGKRPSLADVVKISHPGKKPLFKKLIEGKLEVPYTWETQLSTTPKDQHKEVWEKMISSKKLPYMAALRNIRNIVKSGVNNLDEFLSYISDSKSIKFSKQLPFRFFSAAKEMERFFEQESQFSTKRGKVMDSIYKAMDISFENLPKLKGVTFATSDMSGSMSWNSISKNSTIFPSDIASLFLAAVPNISDEYLTSVFACRHEMVNLNKGSVLKNMEMIKSKNVGGSTNLYLSIEHILKNKIFVDRIIVFSDMQAYGSGSVERLVSEYRSKINPNVWIHSIDLCGYGSSVFNPQHPKVSTIGGWSDKVFDFIEYAEEGTDSLVSRIQKY